MTPAWTESYVKRINESWGPLTTEVVASTRSLMQGLAAAANGNQLETCLRGTESSVELYRDAEHGFVLTAYAEGKGRYRAPHDHGAGWVIYAVVEGEVEMGTYAKVTRHGETSLVRRDSTRMDAGSTKIFLPGDIHDTLCLSEKAVILRLTSCDLKKEDAEGRMTRYLL